MRLLKFSTALGLAFALNASILQAAITISNTGQAPTTLGSFSGSGDLSGLTYAGGNNYYAIGDNGANSIYQLNISVNASNGFITGASIDSETLITPGTGGDSEAISFNSLNGNTVFLSDETVNTIYEYDLGTGTRIRTAQIPAVYSNIRANRSFESTTYNALDNSIWTVNEEALTVDGNVSSTSSGTWVRIQKFDSSLNPVAQFGYETNPWSNSSVAPGSSLRGVSEMLMLPDGTLLTLERELTPASFVDPAPFKYSIFTVDISSASDVSAVANLSVGGFTSVTKTLLWSGTGTANFEAMTLGQALDTPNSYSLILLSDNQGGTLPQVLLPLIVDGLTPVAVPEPSSLMLLVCTMLGMGFLLFFRRRVQKLE